MGRAKDITIKPIASKAANKIVKAIHYSGKVVNNSSLHFGVFLDGKCGGALSFGSPLDKRKVLPLVNGTKWNEMLELNRMAFADWLPRNGESRALAVCFRIIRKSYPHIKWVLSFADGTQCGDGTIYRASGFVLTAIKKSNTLIERGDGEVIHEMTLHSNPNSPRDELGGKTFFQVTKGKYDLRAYIDFVKGRILPGFQLRYIYFIDSACRADLAVPEVPFSEIAARGAKMYKGVRSIDSDAPGIQPGSGRCNSDPDAPN